MNAVDTNVVVYALDDDDPTKQAIARELIDRLVQPPAGEESAWRHGLTGRPYSFKRPKKS